MPVYAEPFCPGLSSQHRGRPQRHFTQLRIAEARKHLAQEHLPLFDIALICGFGDQRHITRVFQQLAGTSPSAWRRSQGAMQAGSGGLSPA